MLYNVVLNRVGPGLAGQVSGEAKGYHDRTVRKIGFTSQYLLKLT